MREIFRELFLRKKNRYFYYEQKGFLRDNNFRRKKLDSQKFV